MGKVEELVIGRDEKVRGAKLTVISKTGQRKIAHRPVQKLIPFKIVAENNISDEDPSYQVAEVVDENISRRPTRKAANEGQNLRTVREQYCVNKGRM